MALKNVFSEHVTIMKKNGPSSFFKICSCIQSSV